METLFNSSTLEQEYLKGAFNGYSSLGYDIERDYHNDVYSLAIVNQVVAAMNGIEDEDAILAEYTYIDRDEAEEDIEKLQELTGCIFITI